MAACYGALIHPTMDHGLWINIVVIVQWRDISTKDLRPRALLCQARLHWCLDHIGLRRTQRKGMWIRLCR